MNTCSRCQSALAADALQCPRCGALADTTEPDDLLASSASDPTGLLDRLRAATAGEFTIVRELGRGGMARVYLAHETALDRRVALKLLPPSLAEHAEIVERFQREARTAAKLTHPHVLSVYRVFERSGLTFFTMPYVAGLSLRQILRQTPQLDFELCRRYLREAADALAYAHVQGVIHRDIKPENMLLEGSRDGRLLLTDFGIAKALGAATALTRPGDMMGTPFYMSPEQCEESERLDARSDQYSLGLVAYEMVAGRFPFTAESLAAIVYKHVHEYPAPLDSLRPDVPADLRRVVERAIRKDPAERFPTMADLLEALGPSPARPAAAQRTPAAPERRLRRGAPSLAVPGAAAAVLVVVMAAALLPRWWPAADRGSQLAGESADPAEGADPRFASLDSSAATGEQAGTGSREGGSGALPGLRTSAAPATMGPSDSMAGGTRSGQREAEPGGRQEAELARQAALDALAAARAAAADLTFPDRFTALERQFAGADSALRDSRLVVAALGFASVRQGFDELTAQARTAGAGTEGENAADPDAQGRENAQAASAAAPHDEVRSVIEAYRKAVEAEDLDALARDIYRAQLPAADATFLGRIFELGDQFSIAIEVDSLDVADDEARARIQQRMSYRLARNREPRDTNFELELTFRRADGIWRLTGIER
jgi:tRNA A-37 threonylcarbamoyl transferase component Bud32